MVYVTVVCHMISISQAAKLSYTCVMDDASIFANCSLQLLSSNRQPSRLRYFRLVTGF